MSAFDLQQYLAACQQQVNQRLEYWLKQQNGLAPTLVDAMHYATFNGGKRIRPVLAYAAATAVGGDHHQADDVAAALEMVHSYSLVHDDLPCMDDDDFRRGQPTVHKAFDEATAVLAGDALLTLAFKILASRETHPDAEVRAMLIERLADSSGARGMVGGQMIDMLESDSPRDLNTITRMQRLKTGALISYATEAAGIIGHAREHERSALAGFSNDLGLAYQIADDLLDATGDEETVGKALAKDEDAGKANFVTILGIDGARQRVQLLAEQAKEHLAIFREKANILLQSVDFVLDRTH